MLLGRCGEVMGVREMDEANTGAGTFSLLHLPTLLLLLLCVVLCRVWVQNGAAAAGCCC